MKRILIVLLSVMSVLPSFARDFPYMHEGQTLNYTVFDETAKTCVVARNIVSGEVVIPAIASDGTSEYAVISIGNDAFSYCSLTSVTIPESVTSIGKTAFYSCSSLNSVMIPNSVTYIGEHAFSGCSSLTSVTIPESMTSIESSVFSGCSSLTSMIIPESVTSIGSRAFWNCQSLTSVTIPESVTSIENFAFSDCSSLNTVTIPNCVTTIGSNVFTGCISLNSITIGNSVTSIGNNAFDNCSSLTSVRILGETPPSLGSTNFNSYTTIFVPSVSLNKYISGWGNRFLHIIGYETQISLEINLKKVGGLVEELMRIPTSDLNQIMSLKISGDMNGTDFLALNKLTNIINLDLSEANIREGGENYYSSSTTETDKFKRYQLYALTALQNLVLPNSLKIIDDNAFNGCKNLTSMIIPNSVTSIGGYAFNGCRNLTSVIIGNSVISIGESAFSGCSRLPSVTIGNSVTFIGESAFSYCHSLTSVTIGNSVTSIGESAFYYCPNLTSVTIGSSVTSIGNFVFYYCDNIKDVHIYDLAAWCGIKFYDSSSNPLQNGANLYLGNKLITDCIVPNTVTSIGDYAFINCRSLTSMTIPETVTSIGNSAFSSCLNLTSVAIPKSVTSIGNWAFYGCHSLTSVTIPESVTSIGDVAFSYCLSLTSVTIPESVTSIGCSAFRNCQSLTSMTIPETVTFIGDNAFNDCNNIEKIYCYRKIPIDIESNVFSNYNATLFVPIGSKVHYWLHYTWGKFITIEEFNSASANEIESVSQFYPTDYFNLQGVKVATVLPGETVTGLPDGIYITRCGNSTQKVIVK